MQEDWEGETMLGKIREIGECGKQRRKNLGGRVALPPGKFLRVTLKIALGSFRTL